MPDEKELIQKVQQIREIFSDAPDICKTALENTLKELSKRSPPPSNIRKAGRIGLQEGSVSELTTIIPLAKNGALRLKAIFKLLNGGFHGADLVGSVHDMRFVFLENDSKILFATTYDGNWDSYIDDFATKIPDSMDLIFANCEGWPGIRDAKVKDYILAHQVPADGWYVANPNLSVVESRRLQKIGQALDEFLDKIN